MARLDLTEEVETAEEQADHDATDEAEEALLKYLASIGLEKNERGEIVPTEAASQQAKDAASRVKICSCGFHTCRLIGLYGHPVPVFKEEIEPIPSQMMRDLRALELKGAKA